MSDETLEKQQAASEEKKTTLKVSVSFPISPKKPFKAEEAEKATAGEVKAAAMAYFGVAEDGQHAYYLTHAGEKAADETSLHDLAGHAKEIKFTLVKELIQGRA